MGGCLLSLARDDTTCEDRDRVCTCPTVSPAWRSTRDGTLLLPPRWHLGWDKE